MANNAVNGSASVHRAVPAMRQSLPAEFAARSPSPRRGGQAVAANGTSVSQEEHSFPNFKRDLKESIHSLVRQVSTTLGSRGSEAVASTETGLGSSRPSLAMGSPALPEREVETQTLRAVEELWKQNQMLRERNAGLREEILSQDGVFTSVNVPVRGAWPKSAAQMANPSPLAQTASPVRAVTAARALSPPRPGGNYVYPARSVTGPPQATVSWPIPPDGRG